jgi:hypothetical protein
MGFISVCDFKLNRNTYFLLLYIYIYIYIYIFFFYYYKSGYTECLFLRYPKNFNFPNRILRVVHRYFN